MTAEVFWLCRRDPRRINRELEGFKGPLIDIRTSALCGLLFYQNNNQDCVQCDLSSSQHEFDPLLVKQAADCIVVHQNVSPPALHTVGDPTSGLEGDILGSGGAYIWPFSKTCDALFLAGEIKWFYKNPCLLWRCILSCNLFYCVCVTIMFLNHKTVS